MDSIINPRAVIGDNAPPLGERLKADHADLLKRVAEALDLVPEKLRPIQNGEEAQGYTDAAKALKDIEKEADAAFEPEKKPWRDGAKVVDDFFAFRKKLEAGAKRAVNAINVWQTAQLAAKRRIEAEEAEQARREAELFEEPVVAFVPKVVPREAARVVSESGAMASGGTYWTHRTIDPNKVPRQHLMVNEAALKAAVDGGARAIEGVEIYEAVRTSIR